MTPAYLRLAVVVAPLAIFIGCERSADVAGSSTVSKPSVPPAPPAPPSPPGTPPAPRTGSSGNATGANEWTVHTSQVGRFKAMFPPGKIEDREEPTTTSDGPAVRKGTCVRIPNYGNFYVWYTKKSNASADPDGDCRYVADKATSGMAAASGGEVLSNVERAVGSHKGRQCKVTMKRPIDAVQHILYVVDRDYLYQVMVVGPPGTPSDAEVEKFFASIIILE
jgi:hypothetical protein